MKKALSRRTFLRGSGGIMVALPFLDAMIPAFASAQTAKTKRFITVVGGTVCGHTGYNPVTVGPLGTLGLSWSAMQNIKDKISLVSNQKLETWNEALGQSYMPGASHAGQHGFTIAPMLAGIGSYDAQQIQCSGTTAKRQGSETVDQIVAKLIAQGTRFESLQIKCQAQVYNGQAGVGNNGVISAKKSASGIMTALPPVVSPLALYNMLFASGVPTMTPTPTPAPTATPKPGATPAPTPAPTPTPSATPSQLLMRRKSVLDVILDDSKRLLAAVGGEDKARLEAHFDEIRELERGVSASVGLPAHNLTRPTAGSGCSVPTTPGPDPALGSSGFGGFSGETQRGQTQADLIAYALSCDLTRVVSWMLTNNQTWLGSGGISGGTEMHNDSHNAARDVIAKNVNWHSALFARLVENLAARSDANGTLLDNTFMSMIFTEGATAHSRVNMTTVIAGSPSRVNIGQHIDSKQQHPALLQIAGLQAIGLNINTLGEMSGAMAGVLK